MKRKRKHAKWWVRILRTLGVALAIPLAIYLYQPQRYDLFPRPAPSPNPPVDPESSQLFSKEARVVVVAAHPDDPEFYMGGTLLRLHQAGAQIAIVMCTDGDKGYYPWFMTDPAKNRVVRRAEQIAAARHYGATVYFLARRDGRLKADDALISAVQSAMRQFHPNFLLTFDPEYPPRIQHRDHLQSGVAGIAAAQRMPEIRWILRFATRAPNYVVDVTKVWDQRQDILAVHKSQFYGKHLDGIREMIGDRSNQEGAPRGFEDGEAFRCSKS
jgi:LmbE family N-acetylglucosaminyl deacetylase